MAERQPAPMEVAKAIFGDEKFAEILDHLATRGGAEAPPPSPPPSYPASPLKRRRATGDEMEARAAFFIAYARAHHPVTVRGLYYQAEVHGVPGIDKTDAGYDKVQAQVLKLRRAGRLDYKWIADATRWMRKPASFDDVEDALLTTPQRKARPSPGFWRPAARPSRQPNWMHGSRHWRGARGSEGGLRAPHRAT